MSTRHRQYVYRSMPVIVLAAMVVCVYHVWFFTPGLITAGDLPYYSSSRLSDWLPFPSVWDTTVLLGSYNIVTAPLFPVYVSHAILNLSGVDWALNERIVWFVPSLAAPSLSTFLLARLLLKDRSAALISAVAATMNAYVYLLYEGGQFGVAQGFGLMPLVLWSFARGQRCHVATRYIVTGLIMALQAVYDIRSTYITVGVLIVYVLFEAGHIFACRLRYPPLVMFRVLGIAQLGTALCVMACLHLWWILPALFVHGPALPPSYTDIAAVHALSQVNLGQALALFHPFWFANDGHSYTTNPLFYAVPLIIVWLIRMRPTRLILFSATIALIAVFFVKGDTEPAGGLYDWLFLHLPGFTFFRDPSKFFQPLVLAYALLLGAAAQAWRRRARVGPPVRTLPGLIWAATLLAIAVFPAYPALVGQAGGTFRISDMPNDYQRLNALIDSQSAFFRVLWVPARPRFGTTSSRHPALDASMLRTCCTRAAASGEPWAWLAAPSAIRILSALSIRYIVVPGETKDDDFSPLPWIQQGAGHNASRYVAALRALLPYLHVFTVGHLRVFTNPQWYPELFLATFVSRSPGPTRCTLGTLRLSSRCPPLGTAVMPGSVGVVRKSSWVSEYWYDAYVRVDRAPAYLVFQQAYDPNWIASVYRGNAPVPFWSTPWSSHIDNADHVLANGYANAWLLRQSGEYHVVLEYLPQRLAFLGLAASAMCLLILIGSLLWRFHRQRQSASSTSEHRQPREGRLSEIGERAY